MAGNLQRTRRLRSLGDRPVPELMGSIVSKPSVMAAWESLVLRNVGVDRVRKVKVSTLKREFDSLTFEAGESIDDFGMRLSRITSWRFSASNTRRKKL
jgi:hypothetical protein